MMKEKWINDASIEEDPLLIVAPTTLLLAFLWLTQKFSVELLCGLD